MVNFLSVPIVSRFTAGGPPSLRGRPPSILRAKAFVEGVAGVRRALCERNRLLRVVVDVRRPCSERTCFRQAFRRAATPLAIIPACGRDFRQQHGEATNVHVQTLVFSMQLGATIKNIQNRKTQILLRL